MFADFRALAIMANTAPLFNLFLHVFPDISRRNGPGGGYWTLVCQAVENVEDLATEVGRDKRPRAPLGDIAEKFDTTEDDRTQDEAVVGTTKRGKVRT